jgi:hypothetical protein
LELGGSAGEVRQRGAFIYEVTAGLVVRVTAYTDIDEARAAAERLAESRGRQCRRRTPARFAPLWSTGTRAAVGSQPSS